MRRSFACILLLLLAVFFAVQAGAEVVISITNSDGSSVKVEAIEEEAEAVPAAPAEGDPDAREAFIDGILALAKALQSDEVRAFIDETYQGAVVPIF